MKMDKKNIIFAVTLIVIFIVLVFGIGSLKNNGTTQNSTTTGANNVGNSTVVSSEKIFNQDDLFTSRDLEQEADLSSATKYEVTDNNDINITKEGVYVITGTASNVTINVEVGDEEKVQLVLDNLSISNQDKECIHVENADKVFITTTTQSSLKYSVTDTENATGAIFARDDLVFNGNGTLTINSDNNGIVGKDDVKITGGTYNITATKNCVRANDSICIADGTFNLKAGSDGLHAENNDDDSKGYIYINSCSLIIDAGDDGIHAVSIVQIDGGTISINAAEAIEGTYIQINDGTITINATDDGINAAKKSSAYTPTVMINGGNIKIDMGQGDTDGVDSNGDIIINSGTIEVTGNSTFDYDGKAEHNGGTIIINGEETDTIPNQFMGGGMHGERNGEMTPPDMDGNFNGDMTPLDFSGDFDGKKMPPDFNGEFDGTRTPPNFSGDFNGERPSRGSRPQRVEQSS